MEAQIGSIVEFYHAKSNWRGRVFNIRDNNLEITVDGYPEIFYIPRDYSRLWVMKNLAPIM